MPQNLELKAHLPNPDAAIEIARQLGALDSGLLEQTDVYFHTAEGRLKLRYETEQPTLLVAYARPDRPGIRGSDFSLLPIDDGPGLERSLATVLGIRCRVVKSRRLFLLDGDARIHIDQVEGLGGFFEFEVPIGPDRNAVAAEALAAALRQAFAPVLGPEVEGSYSDLIEKR